MSTQIWKLDAEKRMQRKMTPIHLCRENNFKSILFGGGARGFAPPCIFILTEKWFYQKVVDFSYHLIVNKICVQLIIKDFVGKKFIVCRESFRFKQTESINSVQSSLN